METITYRHYGKVTDLKHPASRKHRCLIFQLPVSSLNRHDIIIPSHETALGKLVDQFLMPFRDERTFQLYQDQILRKIVAQLKLLSDDIRPLNITLFIKLATNVLNLVHSQIGRQILI